MMFMMPIRGTNRGLIEAIGVNFAPAAIRRCPSAVPTAASLKRSLRRNDFSRKSLPIRGTNRGLIEAPRGSGTTGTSRTCPSAVPTAASLKRDLFAAGTLRGRSAHPRYQPRPH